MPTARASSTATSSRRTCCWTATATSGWPTSAWPRRSARDDLTHTGDIVGTVRYMAPERFRGEGDARADIYALGLTLYELLALRPAFDEADRASLIRQVTQEDPPRLRKLNRRVPPDLETIVHKAIAREPGQRYATARAAGRGPEAVPRGPADPGAAGLGDRAGLAVVQAEPGGGRAARRHRAVLVVGTAVSTYFAVRATRGETRAL